MSSVFAALNVSEELTELDAEEHSRELQIEEAFTVFQRALKCQKESRFQDAREAYKELFKIDVVSGELTTSPTISTLRHLAHRNRGLLFFEELRSTVEDLDPEGMVKLLRDSIEDLVESLQYTDGDSSVVNLLLAMFQMFGKERLLRYTVEYELTKEENEDLLTHSRRRNIYPETQSYLKKEQAILASLGLPSKAVIAPELQFPDLSFLTPVKEYLKLQQVEKDVDRRKCIKLAEVSINEVAAALGLPLSRPKAKYQRFMDAYQLRDDIIVDFKFELPGVPVKTENVPSAEPEIECALQVDNGAKRPIDDAPHRSSKRMKLQDEEASSDESIVHASRFLGAVSSLLGFEISYPVTTEYSAAAKDFTHCINNWSHKFSDLFLQESAKNNADLAIVEIINSTIPGEAESDNVDHTVATSRVRNFIDQVNASSVSYHEVRSLFLSLALSRTDDFSFILDYPLEKDTYSLIESFVVTCDETGLGSDQVVSMIEILLEYWLRLRQQSNVMGLSPKVLHDLQASLSHVDGLFLKWLKFIEEATIDSDEINIRLEWCKLLYSENQDDTDLKNLHEKLSCLYDECEKLLGLEVISFVNYKLIPDLSAAGIKKQKDKLDLVTTFDKTLNQDDADPEEIVELLEGILLDIQLQGGAEIPDSMKIFVNSCPIGLRLRLWKNLLDSYASGLNMTGYSNALSKLIPLLLGSISGETYSTHSEAQRMQNLLTVLGYYGMFVEGFVKTLIELNWDAEFSPSLLTPVVRFFQILYPFCLHNNLPDLKTKYAMKLRDIIADTLTMIICLHNRSTLEASPDSCYDLLSVIHEELGNRRFCDASSGRFLKLSQYMLKDADSSKFEYDILQHLNCRFHIAISSESFTPSNHDSQKVALTKDSALQFSDYILGALYRKKDPLCSIPKPDLKTALDCFYEAVGDPDIESPTVARNETLLNQFYAQPLDLRTLRDSFWGSLFVDLTKAKTSEQYIIDRGLYYFEAAASLNLFKSRRKQAQGKASDLEQVVKLLKADLLSGSQRLETWLFLGEAFSLQVEDDLTWTSDKLNSIEKKVSVATTQKMSILSYAMAFNIYVNDPNASKTSGTMLCELFSRELYHSIMRPMDGFAFLGTMEKKVLTSNGVVTTPLSMDKPKTQFVLKLVLKLLKMAISLDGDSWTNYFYLAKVFYKLDQPHMKVLNASLRACALSSSGIEAHYQTCSLIYKFFKRGLLTESKAISRLKLITGMLGELVPEEGIECEVSSLLISALRKLVLMDKKKWHHRPRFRIATMLYDMGYYKRAATEMEGFIVLRALNKTLVNIWKPETEPPGKHFVYTYQYCSFYLSIAEHIGDLQTITLFIKKLRRFGPGMIDLPTVWEKACGLICNLVRSIVGARADYTDMEVPKLLYTDFMVKAQKLTDKLRDGELSETDIFIIVLLYEISEVRRMNNGFGATSFVDDTLNAVYLKFYFERVSDIEVGLAVVEGADSTVKSKVARRDIITVATTMLKALDVKIKEHRASDDVDIRFPEGFTYGTKSVSLDIESSDARSATVVTPEKNVLDGEEELESQKAEEPASLEEQAQKVEATETDAKTPNTESIPTEPILEGKKPPA